MSMKPNNRSGAALRERLEIAEKATPEDENTLWTVDPAVRGDLCIRDAFNERILTMEDCTAMETARHIAASSPDVVRADIEEILRLRKERDWLLREVSRNNRMPVFCPMPDGYECLDHVGDECKSIDDKMRVGCWRAAVRCAVKCMEKKDNAE